MKKAHTFNAERGTFTLFDPETGKDWSNHLFNGKSYVMSVTHLGATYSRYINEESVQVTLNCPLSSFLYVRDGETGKYWNVSGYPALRRVHGYRCEHGQQYSRISSVCENIGCTLTFAVAPDDTREVWMVQVQNKSARPRRIELFAATAFDLNGFAQPVYYSAVTTSYTSFLEEIGAVFCENHDPYRPHEISNGYLLCTAPVKAYEGNYEKFIGTKGTMSAPRVLETKGNLGNGTATVRSRGGILQTEVLLSPGERKTVCFVLGLISGRRELTDRAREIKESCEEIVENALKGEGRYGNLRTVCPEEQFNRIFNFWTEHQINYCMLGKKAVRDNAQLGMAMLSFDPALAKRTIEECLVHECADGHAVLTWFPYPEKNLYSDPSAWLIYAVCGYLKETGDFSWLQQIFPYMDEGEGTVYDHLKRAAGWFSKEENYGCHRLPLLHLADWNDALNIPDEKAESVLMAMFICKAFSELEGLAERVQDGAFQAEMHTRRLALAETVNKTSFNGEYYVRAFSRFGTVGDKTDDNGGKIYINPQSWSILSGVCPEERVPQIVRAMDSMETELGIPLCDPPYAKYDERVGRMSGMLPGVYENGGIYNHAGCFKVMADCKLGRGDHALAALKKIVPDGANNPSSLTTAEPYVFTNCYLMHPSVKMEVGFSWQTGTSAWGLMCYYEGLLGLLPEYDGLRVRPAFPSGWKQAQAWRNFRGSRLHIVYQNRGGSCVRLKADGKPLGGTLIPPFADGKPHEIEVLLEKGE